MNNLFFLPLIILVILTVSMSGLYLSYPQEEKEIDVFDFPLGEPANITPYSTSIDSENIVSLKVGGEGSTEKDSFEPGDIQLSQPYKSGEFRNETHFLEKYPFPPLGKPYKIQSEIQEKALKQQGY